MKPWIAELATVSYAAMLAHCLCTLPWRNPRSTLSRIGRSNASANSGDGGWRPTWSRWRAENRKSYTHHSMHGAEREKSWSLGCGARVEKVRQQVSVCSEMWLRAILRRCGLALGVE